LRFFHGDDPEEEGTKKGIVVQIFSREIVADNLTLVKILVKLNLTDDHPIIHNINAIA
jgi:hypothetical protein